MYMVVEFQKHDDETLAGILTTHATNNEAEQKYHTILSFAAVSTIPKHGAIIINDDGVPIKYDTYTHGTGEFSPV